MEVLPRWLAVVAVLAAAMCLPSKSQPQTNRLNYGCSQYNATNNQNFFDNLNSTFADVRTQLAAGKWFATSQQARSSDPVYVMAQCRNYMSIQDCLACYNTAEMQIRNCSAANGARVIYDGCFLRYESNGFFNDSTGQGGSQICSSNTTRQSQEFSTLGNTLMADLVTAAPRTTNYFAAAKRSAPASNNGGAVNSTTIYAIAQCVESITPDGCRGCLTQSLGDVDSCFPNTNGRAYAAACFLRYSDSPFFADNQTMDITPFLKQPGKSNKKKVAIIGGVAGGAGGVVLILIGFLIWYKLSRKPKAASSRANILGSTELQGPNIYRYKDLKDATGNFSEENKLGEGGFGDVYKATLKNGVNVAVKKLDVSYNRAKTDFETEVRLLSNVHHRNLVRLLGCCSKGAELLLVYEYMMNGSLDRFLYASSEKQGALTWKQRLDIIFGTARGLAYLHEEYHVCIIHRDIKPSNILLSDDFQPKIADFGLARLLPGNQSHVSTKFAGTLGYTAPEYAIHGHLSEKVDIYSFGVVILEIISGRRGSDQNTECETEYLLDEAWKLYETGMHQKLIDAALDASEYTEEDIKKLVEIALICTQSPPSSRPTMSEVVVMLLSSNNNAVDHRPRNRPLSSYGSQFVSDDPSVTTGSGNSNATASISHFTGR